MTNPTGVPNRPGPDQPRRRDAVAPAGGTR
jgi:hypothetical protein